MERGGIAHFATGTIEKDMPYVPLVPAAAGISVNVFSPNRKAGREDMVPSKSVSMGHGSRGAVAAARPGRQGRTGAHEYSEHVFYKHSRALQDSCPCIAAEKERWRPAEGGLVQDRLFLQSDGGRGPSKEVSSRRALMTTTLLTTHPS